MRITKDAAYKISVKLTEKKLEEVKQLEMDYRQFVFDSYNKQVPDKVIECYNEHGEFFSVSTGINFSGHGFNYERVAVPKDQKVIDNSNHVANLKLDDKLATKIMRLKNRHEGKKDAYRKLRDEIEGALVSLRTYKRIEENFPEAKEFLPASETLALAINFSDIRKKLI